MSGDVNVAPFRLYVALEEKREDLLGIVFGLELLTW